YTIPPEPEPEPVEDGEAVVEEAEEEEIGPPPPPPPAIFQQLEAIGARYAVHAGPDLLTFTVTAPRAALPTLLALEGTRLSAPLDNVTEDDLAAAKAELGAARPDPRVDLWDVVAPTLLPADHPYQPARDVTSADFGDVAQYIQKAYTPDNLMITVSGDLSEIDDLKQFLEDGLQGLLIQEAEEEEEAPEDPETPQDPEDEEDPEGEEAPSSGPSGFVIEDTSCVDELPENRPEAPEVAAVRTGWSYAAVPSPRTLIAWPLPGAYREDALYFETMAILVEEFMQRGLSSKSPPGLLPAEVVSCRYLPALEVGALVCELPMNRQGDEKKVAQTALRALGPLWYGSGLTQTRNALFELQDRARGRLLQRAADYYDGDFSEIAAADTYDRLVGTPFPYLSRISELEEIDPKKLLEMTRKRADLPKATIIGLVPDGWMDYEDVGMVDGLSLAGPWAPLPPAWEPPPPPEPSEEDEEEETEAEEETAEEEAEEVEPLTADALAAIAANPILDGVQTLKIGEMTLVVVNKPGFPVLQLSVVQPGGTFREPALGLDALTWHMTAPYLPQKEDLFVPDFPLNGQGTWTVTRGAEGWVRTLEGPAGNLEGMLYILRMAVSDPTEAKGLRPQYYATADKRYRPTLWQMARFSALDTYFGTDHPMARPRQARKGAIKKLSEAQVNAWAMQINQPSNTTLVVMGPVDLDEVKDAVQGSFGDWSVNASPMGDVEVVVPPEQAAIVMDAPTALARMELRCPLSSSAPAARDLMVDMLQLSYWEATREQPPARMQMTVETVAGNSWLRATAEARPEQIGDVIAGTRRVLSDELSMYRLIVKQQRVEAVRVALVESLEAKLEELGRRNRRERDRIGQILEAVDEIEPMEEEDTDATMKMVEDLKALFTSGEPFPEPEEDEDGDEDEDEDEMEEIAFEDAPRPTLEDARLRRAHHYAAAAPTRSAVMALLPTSLSSAAYAAGLVEADEEALGRQLSKCVGHDVVSVFGPGAAVSASLDKAGVSYTTLDPKALKKR
ncbi:MAG: hypothetical protein AAFV53_37125, partial [Myxococcota bacterium]